MPDDGDGSHRYACGEGTALHVYVSPANAGKATATLATWYIPDLVHVVDELRANGVSFERFDDPQLRTDARGIHSLGVGQVAWCKDPDVLEIVEGQRPRDKRLRRDPSIVR
jgi:hypothetical protein